MARLKPKPNASPTYRQIWRIVDGAVRLALTTHPEYLAPGVSPKTVRNSIVKRAVGAINGYAEQSAWVRSGSSPADEETDPVLRFGSVAAGRPLPQRTTLALPADRRAGGSCTAPSCSVGEARRPSAVRPFGEQADA